MQVSGQFDVTLKVNGTDLDLSVSKLQYLTIFESAQQLVPTIELLIHDLNYERDGITPIYDGSLLEITFQALTDEKASTALSMTFRVFSIEAQQQNVAISLKVTGYLDVKDYFMTAKHEFIKGGASTVAEHIAGLSNLEADIDPSTDSMTWIRSGETGGQFMQKVTDHAWRDGESAFVTAVCKDRVLRFLNIGERKKDQNTNWTFLIADSMFVPTEITEVPINAFKTVQKTGQYNKWSGYGVYANQFNLDTGVLEDIFIDTITKPTTDYLSINADLAEPTRYVSGPHISDNVHENYFRAEVQNKKILATFSNRIVCTTTRPRDVRLLDRVELKPKEVDGTLLQVYEGMYFVDGIQTAILDNGLVTQYSLLREGIRVRDGTEVNLK